MRKMLKKCLTIFTAGALAASVFSLAACGTKFTPPTGGPLDSDAVESNGGFVVKKGDWIYFINGVETYTSDNTYGEPVKGALMRVKESDVRSGNASDAETVIPSLMVASDYTSGFYIYGGRVYFATPSNVKNTSGVVENSYLDFKSCKLDGSDIVSYFNVSNNATVYRFVEEEGRVYLLYVDSNELHSFNTEDKTDTTLAANVGEYLLDSTDKTNPVIYYTMSVSSELDATDGSAVNREYTQIYRVSAATTEAPYEYRWNQEYLDANDGEAPYTNLGTIVLDGVGSMWKNDPGQFTHDLGADVTPSTAKGFTYTLQSYTNDGIYFTRSDLTTTGTVGEDGWLYYLSEERIKASGWNSVTGNENEKLDVVAQNTTNAGSAAIFYIEETETALHHYLYVSDGDLFRADVPKSGNGVPEITRIAYGVGSASLVRIDENGADGKYRFVYYTVSGGSGNNIFRAVYNGDAEDYKTLNYEENKPYLPVQILEIEHARSWYNFEIVDSLLFFADAEAVGSNNFNYIAAVNLGGEEGALNNLALSERNDAYAEVMGDDGYLADLASDNKAHLSTALRYFFYTGKTEQFYANIEEAKDKTGKEETLYSADEVKAFEEYTKDETKKTRSDFITSIGKMNDSDAEAYANYWQTALEHYVEPTETAGGLPGWAWALIGVAIGLAVVGAGVAAFFLLRGKNKSEDENKQKKFVDTSDDDKDVDVYADDHVEPLVRETEETATNGEAAENTATEGTTEETDSNGEAAENTATVGTTEQTDSNGEATENAATVGTNEETTSNGEATEEKNPE